MLGCILVKSWLNAGQEPSSRAILIENWDRLLLQLKWRRCRAPIRAARMSRALACAQHSGSHLSDFIRVARLASCQCCPEQAW